ncbi:ABC transporter ATP-binding protein [Roseibium algae]|uniref:ABC transporter ATP-binding protein n=1 Tax=Roseibium algae TaxID=3123038 RepID=A0ABU8TFR0_9HYPH
MTILSLNNVSKSFGALKVSQNITFDLAKGEALGVIGPNGAGKSTLFNLVTGNLSVDEGQISFEGKDITKIPPMARCIGGIGRTFQIPQPFEQLTVFENLIVSGTYGNNVPERDVSVECANILVETGLIDRANDVAGKLSLLERKRLELARALATRPNVLLLDEIAGGLTEGECHALIATIKKIHATGMSIIWIEHVLHALTSVAQRLLVLDFGKVIGIGDPDAIMASKDVREIYLGLDV